MEHAKKNNMKVRGYVSMVMGCPYEGEVKPEKVEKLVDNIEKVQRVYNYEKVEKVE